MVYFIKIKRKEAVMAEVIRINKDIAGNKTEPERKIKRDRRENAQETQNTGSRQF